MAQTASQLIPSSFQPILQVEGRSVVIDHAAAPAAPASAEKGVPSRIAVTPRFIERIDTAQLPENIRDRVADVLAPLVGQQGISEAEIERRLLLAGDLPGSVLQASLSPGSAPGGVVLSLAARYKPITGTFSINNLLPGRLGTYNASLALDFNSTLGRGDLVYLRASDALLRGTDGVFFTAAPRNRTLAGGVTVPLGNGGLALNLEATMARTAPTDGAGDLAFLSDFSRLSARLSYPLVRSHGVTLNLTAVFDAQQEQVKGPDGSALSEDRLRILRAGADLSWSILGNGLLTAGMTGSLGLKGLGARGAAAAAAAGQVPLSRPGADAGFHKLDVSLGYRQTLTEHLLVDLALQAQTSFGQPLLRSEQIGLGSIAGLSTFAPGLMQGDDGFVLRGEAQAPFSIPVILPFALPAIPAQQGSGLPGGGVTHGTVRLAPYLFGAYGGVQLHQPSAAETGWTQGASYGVGMRFGDAEQASFSASSHTLEYGRTQRFGSGPNEDRFTFSTALHF